MKTIKWCVLGAGFFGVNAYSEPALTLSGEVNYGEACQVNVRKFCDVAT